MQTRRALFNNDQWRLWPQNSWMGEGGWPPRRILRSSSACLQQGRANVGCPWAKSPAGPGGRRYPSEDQEQWRIQLTVALAHRQFTLTIIFATKCCCVWKAPIIF